jgi:hypothetical protein
VELLHTIAMLHLGYYLTLLTNLPTFFLSRNSEPVWSTDMSYLLTAFLGVVVEVNNKK